MSAVARMRSSKVMPGRNGVFSWPVLIASTTSGSRAHSTVLSPARMATVASPVPQAPPPTTPMQSTPSASHLVRPHPAAHAGVWQGPKALLWTVAPFFHPSTSSGRTALLFGSW